MSSQNQTPITNNTLTEAQIAVFARILDSPKGQELQREAERAAESQREEARQRLGEAITALDAEFATRERKAIADHERQKALHWELHCKAMEAKAKSEELERELTRVRHEASNKRQRLLADLRVLAPATYDDAYNKLDALAESLRSEKVQANWEYRETASGRHRRATATNQEAIERRSTAVGEARQALYELSGSYVRPSDLDRRVQAILARIPAGLTGPTPAEAIKDAPWKRY